MINYYDILARWAVHRAIEDWIETGWEGSLPEIGEEDYKRVTCRMKDFVRGEPTDEEVEAAIRWCEKRAREWEEKNEANQEV